MVHVITGKAWKYVCIEWNRALQTHLKFGAIWTLHLVRNAISMDLHTIRTPEMRTARYSIKRTLGLAPTVSPPIQTHPYSGHFGNKFVDSLAKQTKR